MLKYTIKNIKNIPFEKAHGTGLRQILVTSEKFTNSPLEAIARTSLEAGKMFDWHIHKNIDEICIVLKGSGKFYWENKIAEYKEGDIITIPANSTHKIEATGNNVNDFYFIRIKCLL